MAEPVVDTIQETDKVENEKYEEKSDENGNLETDSSVICALNIVVILSYLSLSAEESSNFEEIDEREMGNYDHKLKPGASRSNVVSRKRELNEFRSVVGKQTSKDHTKIRDCRINYTHIWNLFSDTAEDCEFLEATLKKSKIPNKAKSRISKYSQLG